MEVKHQGEWGTVNNYKWGLEEAAVVCRQLGCGAAVDALQRVHFGPAVGPIWFNAIYCRGTESDITECSYPTVKDYRPEGLSHDQDAGVVCSGKACLVWEGISSRKSLSLMPSLIIRIWITDFSTYLGEDSSHTVIPRALGVQGSRRAFLAMDSKGSRSSVHCALPVCVMCHRRQ